LGFESNYLSIIYRYDLLRRDQVHTNNKLGSTILLSLILRDGYWAYLMINMLKKLIALNAFYKNIYL